MDPGLLLAENFGRFAAIVGLIIATPMFAWGGYLWMTSMGDPNRSAAARNAVISVCIGIVVIGCSLLLPRAISEFVVAPSGGMVLEQESGINCDGLLRKQLVVNRAASTPSRMDFLVRRIQAGFEDCSESFWSPEVRLHSHGSVEGCYDVGDGSISGVKIPAGLERGLYRPSRRDANNNIMVHFTVSGPPSDNSLCWMYINALDVWVEGYLR